MWTARVDGAHVHAYMRWNLKGCVFTGKTFVAPSSSALGCYYTAAYGESPGPVHMLQKLGSRGKFGRSNFETLKLYTQNTFERKQ